MQAGVEVLDFFFNLQPSDRGRNVRLETKDCQMKYKNYDENETNRPYVYRFHITDDIGEHVAYLGR